MDVIGVVVDEYIREIEWATYGQTVLHPIVFFLVFAMCFLVVRAKRAQAVLPLLVIATLVTHQQRIVILSIDFSMQRIIVFVALTVLIAKGEFRSFRVVTLDKALVAWVVLSVLMSVVGTPSISNLINRMGFAADSLGMYLVVRCYVRTHADLVVALKSFALVLIAIAAGMTYEQLSGKNPFHFMGAREFVGIRDGRLRCQGALGHPILAGSLGASAVPMMIGLALGCRKFRLLALFGALSGFAITLTSSSSGPAICFVGGGLAWGLWIVRRWTRQMLSVTVILLVILHFVREKPVWHLIGRMSDLVGGTGYHRVRLIDAWIRNFGQWWFSGTQNTVHWGWGLQDTTNWYISNSLGGGLATLIAFIVMLTVAFKTVGMARRDRRKLSARSGLSPRSIEFLAWGLGASLAAHCLAWLSVSYFGTMKLVFFLQLGLFPALISSTSQIGGKAGRIRHVGVNSEYNVEKPS